MQKVLVVRNIKAGRKVAIKYKKQVLDFLLSNNLKFKIIEVEELNSVDVSEYDTVIAMGGDGTVSKCAQLVINTDKVLGILPCGTANLLASNLGISTNIKNALNILGKNISKIDVVEVNWKQSILRVGFGFDSNIICNTPQSIKNKFGYFSYLIAGILYSFRLKNKKYKFSIDNQFFEVDASCFIVSNAANMYKNIFEVAANSSAQDGLFDIFILKTTNPFVLFFELVKIFLGIKKNNFHTLYIQTSNLIIYNDWLNSHIDGEKHNFNCDIHFKIIEKSVNIYVK